MALSVERILQRLFRQLGELVGRHPWRFLLTSLVLGLVLTIGIVRCKYGLKFSEIVEPDGGIFVTRRHALEALFPGNHSYNFDLTRVSRIDNMARLILIPHHPRNNIFDKQLFDEILHLDAVIRNISVTAGDGVRYTYKDICAKKKKVCFNNEVLELAPLVDDIQRGHYKIKYPLTYIAKTMSVKPYSLYLGDVEIDDAGFVTRSGAVSLWYFLDFWNTTHPDVLNEWENEFVRQLQNYRSQNFELVMITSESFIKEMDKSFLFILPCLVVSFILAIAFAVVANIMTDWSLSKPWLGIAGMVTSFLGIGSAFGVCQLFDIPIFIVHVVVVIMMVGIALDDTFVLLAAWRASNRSLSVEARMREAYGQCGIAISVTSLTNLLSFCIGALTPLALTRIFSIYAAACVLACYIYTLTFFGACMALTGRMEAQGRHGLFCWKPVVPKSVALKENRSLAFRLLWTGGRDPTDPTNPLDNSEHCCVTLFKTYSDYIFSQGGMCFLAVLYVTYLAISIWGAFSFEVQTKQEHLLNQDSYAYKYFTVQYKYFPEYQFRMQLVLDQPLDYSSPSVQNEVEALLQKLENRSHIASSYFTESWLRTYTRFLKASRLWWWYRGHRCGDQQGFLYCLREVFLKLPGTDRFENDIVFNENGTEILASRFFIQSKDVSSADEGLKMIEAIEASYKDSPFHVFMYNYIFGLVEHVKILKQVTFNSVAYAIAAMVIVALFCMPRLEFLFLIGFAIISVEIGLVGFLALHGIKLNAMNAIFFIISVGFSVDNSAHILCAYKESKSKTPKDKFKDAFSHIGLPIVQGAVSSIIVILPLLFYSSKLYRNSGIFVTYIYLFSMVHSLCFVPLVFLCSNSFYRLLFPESPLQSKSENTKMCI